MPFNLQGQKKMSKKEKNGIMLCLDLSLPGIACKGRCLRHEKEDEILFFNQASVALLILLQKLRLQPLRHFLWPLPQQQQLLTIMVFFFNNFFQPQLLLLLPATRVTRLIVGDFQIFTAGVARKIFPNHANFTAFYCARIL